MNADEQKLVDIFEHHAHKTLALAVSSTVPSERIAALTFAALVGCLLLGAATMIKQGGPRE